MEVSRERKALLEAAGVTSPIVSTKFPPEMLFDMAEYLLHGPDWTPSASRSTFLRQAVREYISRNLPAAMVNDPWTKNRAQNIQRGYSLLSEVLKNANRDDLIPLLRDVTGLRELERHFPWSDEEELAQLEG